MPDLAAESRAIPPVAAEQTPTANRAGNAAADRIADDSRRSTPLIWFAATTLLSAFLVFQVQPVISKCVLPWFGGTPAVWTTCMLFFQLLLFGGYAYAHLIRSCLRPAGQAIVHLALLAAAVAMLPIEPSDEWKPLGNESPMWYLLWMLSAHVGLPYFVLSSTGPLLQAWLSYREAGERVYRLYALSNVGSLAALLSYPFIVEPTLTVTHQSLVWSLLFCLFVLVQGIIAVGLFRADQCVPTTSQRPNSGFESAAQPTSPWWTWGAWLGLPALASTMLLVVTNHVCQDIAVIPFLWVLPLSLYLVSFIICFDSPRHYRPKLYALMTLVVISLIQSQLFMSTSWRLLAESFFFMLLLFAVCMICHGEVARLKPPPVRLTQFYAFVSAGGALGGVLVAVVCPLVLDNYAELPITLSLITALAFLLFFACCSWRETEYDWSVAGRLKFAAAGLMIAPLLVLLFTPNGETIASERNFFGVLRVTRTAQGLQLVHGTTIHGIQRHGDASAEPTSYYGRQSGIGLALTAMQQSRPELKIGVVGLGCGVLATYGRSSDVFTMIEINPAVIEIAEQHFSFLAASESPIETHLGDGRLVLERMTGRRFDVLVLDAFSSDAIPAHLLTRESMSLYRDRLADGGVLAIHVSNSHLELEPLVHRLAADQGLESRLVSSPGDPELTLKAAQWVLIAAALNPIWNDPLLAPAQSPTADQLRDAPLWTDQHHDLASVLRLW